MRKIKRISDDDYGCEERPEGEPSYVIAVLEDENGALCEKRVTEDFLTEKNYTVGSLWKE